MSGTHRHLSCNIQGTLIDRVDAYAATLGLSRTAAVVILLTAGLSQLPAHAHITTPAPTEEPK